MFYYWSVGSVVVVHRDSEAAAAAAAWEHYPVRSSAEIGLANRDTDREAPTHRGRNKEGEEGRGGVEGTTLI